MLCLQQAGSFCVMVTVNQGLAAGPNCPDWQGGALRVCVVLLCAQADHCRVVSAT